MRDAWAEGPSSTTLRWLLAGLVLMVAMIIGRSWLSERLVPDPRMNRQIEQAEAALAAGRLSVADGSGARQLFESVLAADPDQMRARQGLLAVRERAIAQAQAALAARRLAQAADNLALAESLSAPRVQLQPLQARLRDLRAASSDVTSLLDQEDAAGPDQEQDALDLYQRVLAVDADNARALDGRDRLLGRRLVQAQALLADGRVGQARTVVETVIAEDPAHLDLPPVRAALGEALARLQREQARDLVLARRDEGRRPERAALRYQDLLRADPTLVEATEGLARLATAQAAQAQRQAADFKFRSAEASLARARDWSPAAPGVAAAEAGLRQSRQAQARLRRPAGQRELSRVPALLAEAEQAIARGDYITPPGTSAWDKLRVAAAIAPASPAVARVGRELADASRRCFEQALDQGQLRRAQVCLEAGVVQDITPALSAARSRLAERWLAYAEERIGAGDWTEAETAVAHARRWEPTHPGIAAASARLRTARRTTPVH
jgi:tetratricopeptide (TPR) repeat protein